jgi:effector-binding domain-containing protein
MSYTPCELLNRPAQPVLSIRTHTSVKNLPAVVGQSFGAIAQYLGQLGQAPTGAPFAAYYNMDMENLDVELGYPVAKKVPGQGNIQPSEIPGGKAGACVYTGPYDQMPPAYEALTTWMKAQGHEATGVSYEFYLNAPDVVPPDALQTQIVFPIK